MNHVWILLIPIIGTPLCTYLLSRFERRRVYIKNLERVAIQARQDAVIRRILFEQTRQANLNKIQITEQIDDSARKIISEIESQRPCLSPQENGDSSPRELQQ